MEILYATVTCLSKMGKYPIDMATQSKQTLGGGGCLGVDETKNGDDHPLCHITTQSWTAEETGICKK